MLLQEYFVPLSAVLLFVHSVKPRSFRPKQKELRVRNKQRKRDPMLKLFKIFQFRAAQDSASVLYSICSAHLFLSLQSLRKWKWVKGGRRKHIGSVRELKFIDIFVLDRRQWTVYSFSLLNDTIQRISVYLYIMLRLVYMWSMHIIIPVCMHSDFIQRQRSYTNSK
jgi:hypothetical protein